MNIPRSLPLSGSDFFSLTMEHTMFRVKKEGNICRIILRFDSAIDADSLLSAIKNSGFDEWLSNVRWSRPLPFMTPVWKIKSTKNSLIIKEHTLSEHESTGELLPSLLRSRPVSPFQPPAFRFDLLHYPANKTTLLKTTLLFTWHHALMDAHGAEMLISLIGNSKTEESAYKKPIAANAPPSLWEGLKMWIKLPLRSYNARTAIHSVVKSCRTPITSIMDDKSTSKKSGKPCNSHIYRKISFDLNETEIIENNCMLAGANFKNSLFYLAAVIRALHHVLTGRGCKPAAYVVPVPQDTRKKGSKGPIISNQLTFLFYRAEPDDITSLKGLIKSLSRQMIDQIRNRIPESFTTTMELFRNLPLALFAIQTACATKGQVATFYFSYTGESYFDTRQFLEAKVLEITHIPPVSFPPGLSVSFTRSMGRLSAVLSLVEGCLDSRELVLFESSLRSELLSH